MHRILFNTIFFISGVAGLGYEILWTRMLSVGLGHEIVSVLAVVSAFFSGLALGAWFLDRPVSRSAAPTGWVAAFELVIGIWAVVLIYFLPVLNSWVSKVIGASPSPLHHWSISFLYPFMVLLPATFAMGGTLPFIDPPRNQKARFVKQTIWPLLDPFGPIHLFISYAGAKI